MTPTWTAYHVTSAFDDFDAFILRPGRGFGTRVTVTPWLRPDDAYMVDGEIHAGSLSAVLAQYQRERRRLAAFEAFARAAA